MSLTTVFHAIVTAYLSGVFHYDVTHVPDKLGNTGYSNYFHFNGFAGKLKYLTQICFVLLTIYYWIALICGIFYRKVDSVQTAEARGKLKITRDYLFNVVLFPVALLVVVVFWVLYNIDRNLIFPKKLDEFIPPWLNHSLHTLPLFLVFLEKLLVYHHYQTRRSALVGITALVMLYNGIIFSVYYIDGFWIYPVFKVLSWPMRAVFILCCIIFFFILYVIGEIVTALVYFRNGVTTKPKKKLRKAKKDD